MTMSSREKSTVSASSAASPDFEPIEWSADEEIQLFFALDGLKPVGVNKHFYMACIVNRLSKSLNRDVSAEAVWAHLRTIYNFDLLEELEPLPFPNEEKEFSLPDTEFSALLLKKRAEVGDDTASSTHGSDVENSTKEKSASTKTGNSVGGTHSTKGLDKRVSAKLIDLPKRPNKRTRGSASMESNSPSTTPPPIQSAKRRRF